MPSLIDITGAYSSEANGWESDIITLTGDVYLELSLPSKGRVVIKKAEDIDGPYPKALITPWAGPDFRIRLHHGLKGTACGDCPPTPRNRYIRVITTETPTRAQLAKI